jgi:hypothetical protein
MNVTGRPRFPQGEKPDHLHPADAEQVRGRG